VRIARSCPVLSLPSTARGLRAASCGFLKQLPPDERAADFLCACTYLIQLGVAQQPTGREFVDVAVAAERLYGFERRLSRPLAGEQDGRRGVLACRAPLVAGSRHRVHVSACGVELSVHV